MKNDYRLAIVGLVLLLPVSILISSSLLRFNVSSLLIHPVGVMGGLLLALVLNLVAVLRLETEQHEDGHIAAVTIRIWTRPLNLAVLAVCAVLLVTVLGYAFVENFRPR